MRRASVALALGLLGCGCGRAESFVIGEAHAADAGGTASEAAGGAGGESGAGGGGELVGGAPDDGGAAGAENTDASTGCGVEAPASGERELEVDGATRSYFLALPPDYDPTEALPLVVVGHPRRGTARAVASGGFDGLRNRFRAIYLAPQGVAEPQEPGAAAYTPADAPFIEAMLDEIEARACVDRSRVFATGHSFGGNLALLLAGSLGSRLRAVAGSSGRLLVGSVERWEPVPMLLVNGELDADKATPERTRLAVGVWRAINRCDDVAREDTIGPGCSSWSCEAETIVCVHLGGHERAAWATDAIATFFAGF